MEKRHFWSCDLSDWLKCHCSIFKTIVLELQWIYSTVEFQSSYYSAIQCATDLKLYYVIAYEKVDG